MRMELLEASLPGAPFEGDVLPLDVPQVPQTGQNGFSETGPHRIGRRQIGEDPDSKQLGRLLRLGDRRGKDAARNHGQKVRRFRPPDTTTSPSHGLSCLGIKLGHPRGDVHQGWVRYLATGLRHVRRVDEALRLNVSELVMDRAAEVNGLLCECHARPTVDEVPPEDREPDAGEPMHCAVGVDHELERDVVRRAAVLELGLRPHRRTPRRDKRVRECRLLAFSSQDDRPVIGRGDDETALRIDRPGFVGLGTPCISRFRLPRRDSRQEQQDKGRAAYLEAFKNR